MYFKMPLLLSLTFLVSAQPAKIIFNGEMTEVQKLCFDSGVVRLKEDTKLLNSLPVVTKINLNLGNGEFYSKNKFIQSQIRFYNRDTTKFEIAKINECEIQINSALEPIKEIDQYASTPEAILYGNLKNYGINDTFNEHWGLYQDLNSYLSRSGESTRISLENNFSEKIENLNLTSFHDWNSLSEDYIGGEQSGGGSGKIRVSLKLSSESLLRNYRDKKYLERVLNLNTKYEKIILNKEKLPRSEMFVSEKP